MRYIPLYSQGQIKVQDNLSTAIVVTGWTPYHVVEKRLDPDSYAAIGQLYSPGMGINYLVRNLLYNPQITKVFILNSSKNDKVSGSIQCLIDFFESAFDYLDTEKAYKIKSDIEGYIDGEIDIVSLGKISRMDYDVFTSVDSLVSAINHRSSRVYFLGDSSRLEFPMRKQVSPVRDSNIYGHTVIAETIAEAWLQIIRGIRKYGYISSSSYGQTQELIDFVAVINNEPQDNYLPEYFPVDKGFLSEYVSQVIYDSEDAQDGSYTYGKRLRSYFGEDQIEGAMEALNYDTASRRVTLNLWDSTSDFESPFPPCLVNIWLRILDNKLSLTATFRSNDMFGAWPNNACALRALQVHVQDRLDNVGLGPLVIISQSAHIYEAVWSKADETIEKHTPSTALILDPIGHFLIKYLEEGNLIQVQLVSSKTNLLLKEYISGVAQASKLPQEIIADNPAITASHAAYLGEQISRATFQFETYTQDK